MMPLNYMRSCNGPVKGHVFGQRALLPAIKTVWPSGLRRWLQAPVRKGVGSNPTAVIAEQKKHRGRRNWDSASGAGLLRELNPGPLAP